MTAGAPTIVVSLPARTVAAARDQIQGARASGADAVELRVDFFPADERDRLRELFPSPLPLIATLRSRSEGGEGPDDPETRIPLLVALARHPFRWIDVERSRDLPGAEPLHRPGVQELIVSTHELTPVGPDVWRRLVREPVAKGAVRKVVARASVGQLLSELLPGLPPPGETALVAATVGPSGPLLRAWARRFSFPLVYAALPRSEGGASPAAVERSQIPVDRLRPFLDSAEAPPLFAIAGHPVDHSRSPDLHSRWMKEDGHVGLYVPLDFESEREFVDSIPALAEGGLRGMNVTHPLKRVALDLATELGPGASSCGVANTLTFRPDGVRADNTDLAGILRRLEELLREGRWDGASVGVIGAGGAARATLAAARELGSEAHLWARHVLRAEALAREFSANLVRETATTRPSLVVHATTVGRDPPGAAPTPDLGWLRPGVHVLDWVYGPEDPVVRSACERQGATYEDGHRLLVYQAAASYATWWGNEPTTEEVARALGRGS